MKRFFIAAESEDGRETIACYVEAGDFEVARKRLCEMAREKWPATLWRPLAVTESRMMVPILDTATKDACDDRLRRLWAAADAALKGDIETGVLHKGQVLATQMVMNDVVRDEDPKLADELGWPKCEAAKPGSRELCLQV